MNVEYVNPFIEASQSVLKTVANFNTKIGKVYLKTSPYASDNIAIIVGLTGKLRGQIIFSMCKESAFMIASSMMMGMPVTQLDEMSKSALSELANMIAGNTATILYNKGIGIEITPPTVLMGNNMTISNARLKTVCIPLILKEDQMFEIDVAVEDN